MRRCCQALSCGDAKTHTIPQDDGQEIGYRVRKTAVAQEDGCEPPSVNVCGVRQKLLEIESEAISISALLLETWKRICHSLLRIHVFTVSLEPCNYPLCLRLGQEFEAERLVRGLREVDDRKVRDKCDDNSKQAL